MTNDVERVLIDEEELKAIMTRLGSRITEDYAGKNLLLVSVLKGSVVFMTDLMREIKLPCRIDFMAVSSYGSGAKSTGVVKIVKDLDKDIAGYDVLIVEDILDSGRTLSYIQKLLLSRRPASLRVCTLLDKPSRRETDVNPDYVGAIIEDEFVIGYGLDYDERYRNLPYVGILKRALYED